MTKRAKLSLEPDRRAKAPPSHGFESPTEIPPAGAAAARKAGSQGAVQDQTPTPARAAAGWQAHPPGSTPSPRPVSPDPTPPHSVGAGALAVRLGSLARRPLVRAVAVGLAAGLSLYLLRRRLF